MHLELTRRADKDYNGLSRRLQGQVDNQFDFLLQNLRHASLDAKKYGDTDDLWQARVNRDYRFYFRIIDDTYHILMIIPHLK